MITNESFIKGPLRTTDMDIEKIMGNLKTEEGIALATTQLTLSGVKIPRTYLVKTLFHKIRKALESRQDEMPEYLVRQKVETYCTLLSDQQIIEIIKGPRFQPNPPQEIIDKAKEAHSVYALSVKVGNYKGAAKKYDEASQLSEKAGLWKELGELEHLLHTKILPSLPTKLEIRLTEIPKDKPDILEKGVLYANEKDQTKSYLSPITADFSLIYSAGQEKLMTEKLATIDSIFGIQNQTRNQHYYSPQQLKEIYQKAANRLCIIEKLGKEITFYNHNQQHELNPIKKNQK